MKTSKSAIVTAIAISLLTGSAVFNLRAQTSPAAARETVSNIVARVSERLQLTDEQKTKVEPILQDSFTRRHEVIEKYRGQHDLKSLRAMRRELEPIRNETDTKLKEILTKDQMKELENIRAEMKEKMRQAVKERRKNSN